MIPLHSLLVTRWNPLVRTRSLALSLFLSWPLRITRLPLLRPFYPHSIIRSIPLLLPLPMLLLLGGRPVCAVEICYSPILPTVAGYVLVAVGSFWILGDNVPCVQ